MQSPRFAPLFALAAALALSVAAAAAGSADTTKAQRTAGQPAQAQVAAAPKVFSATGVVTATKPAGTLTINHQPIEGLMPAMEMTFNARPASLTKGVQPGDQVEFQIEGKTYALVAVKVVGHTR
jgi:Cu/Ag efflux protein CusF